MALAHHAGYSIHVVPSALLSGSFLLFSSRVSEEATASSVFRHCILQGATSALDDWTPSCLNIDILPVLTGMLRRHISAGSSLGMKVPFGIAEVGMPAPPPLCHNSTSPNHTTFHTTFTHIHPPQHTSPVLHTWAQPTPSSRQDFQERTACGTITT